MTATLTSPGIPLKERIAKPLLLLICALAPLITLDAWIDIFRMGTVDEELNYVLVAPALVAYLVWVRRARLRDLPVRGGWIGLPLLAGSYAIYTYGYWADPVLWRAGAVALLVSTFIAVYGIEVIRRFSPAIACMVFLIPIDPFGRYRIAEPLQQLTAQATQSACDLMGMRVDRYGAMLSINGVDVTVAEACNGMRMVLTLFLACYFVTFSQPLRPAVRLLILASTPLIAIASNVFRLVPTMWIFGHGSSSAARAFHDISGWVMIVVSYILVLGIISLLRWAGVPVENRPQRR